jgi:hypothetical protein
MGVTFSEASHSSPLPLSCLRMTFDDAEKLTNTYFSHQFQPVTDYSGLQSLFIAAFGVKRVSTDEMLSVLTTCDSVFRDESSV